MKYFGYGKVDGNGDWTVTVPDEITLHEGDKITAISTDDSGNKSNLLILL